MEIRRTLEKTNEPRDLKPSELKAGFCINLTDSDDNRDAVFVEKISETEIVFTSGETRPAYRAYQIILTRDGEKLTDAKGRAVTIFGKAKQYDSMTGEEF
jgi:hypothetical protein